MRISIGLIAALLLTGVTAALADKPGADWISEDQAKSKLMAAGYSSMVHIHGRP
jgi:Peptidase propeptide and YPEB domain